MHTQDDIDQQKALLAAHRRTLAHLLREAAQFSAGYLPSHVANGIAEARADIARIKDWLRTRGIKVEDLPGDVETPDDISPSASGMVGVEGHVDVSGRATGSTAGVNYGTNITNIYQGGAPPADARAALAEAEALLARLPLDTIPDVALLPQGSRMPLSRNPLFVGRDDELKAIARSLLEGQPDGAAITAATGMGGIGKSNLATEFVHRYGQFFAGGVFWLSFADPTGVAGEVAACGGPGAMNLPGFDALTLDDQLARVRQEWQGAIPRLLIFDNCEDEGLLDAWRPTTGGCRVLITSRRTQWDAALDLVPVPVRVLSRPESVALLRKFRPDLAGDDPDLDAIAEELGDLPLALHLAGSFLKLYRDDLTPAAYLVELQTAPLLDHESLLGLDMNISLTNHTLHVGRTFAMSYERLNTSDPVDAFALRLLACAAHFAPGEPIPRDLIMVGVEAEDPADRRRMARALRRLDALGLLDTEANQGLRLHRLLAAFVRQTTVDGAAQAAAEQALIRVVSNLNQEGNLTLVLPLQTHLRHVTEAALARAADEQAASLCWQLGSYLHTLGDWAGARQYLERALAISERNWGSDHPTAAASLNSLGQLLKWQGDLEGARQYMERALAISERNWGSDHAQTAITLNHLGELLIQLGDRAAARQCLEHALVISEREWGSDHPATAYSLNNFGLLLEAQGDLVNARTYYERALDISERVKGSNHAATATSLTKLGTLLQAQGDLAGARPYLERALAIRERMLGPDHPYTATSHGYLGRLLQAQGDLTGARSQLERALDISERILGADNLQTAQSLNNLGLLLQAQGDLAGARPYLERALAIRERRLGSDHSHTAASLNSLGLLLQTHGDLAEARRLFERALVIRERVFGVDHPNTRIVRENLAALDESLLGTSE